MEQIFIWWLIAQAFGLAALPVTRRVFHRLPDQGYAFSKVVGLLIVSYLVWLGASGGVIANNLGGILLAFALLAGLSAALALRNGWRSALASARAFWQAERGQILRVEILFLVAFAGWALVRAYTPSKIVRAYGEKYMEIAFLNGVLNSVRFPPLDPWLAGYAISYYYFGYVMMAIVTRLSGAAPAVGFDLYDALLFALAAAAAYGIVSNLVRASSGTRRAAAWAGLMGAVFLVGMGNLEGVIHGLYSAGRLPEPTVNWLSIPQLASDPQSGSFYPGHDYYNWWWWRGSRVIDDVNLLYEPIGAQPISEFPFFSFLLGDNHPHKLALPFVLLAIGLALNLLLAKSKNSEAIVLPEAVVLPEAEQLPEESATQPATPTAWVNALQAQWSRLARWLFYALALGALGFLNTWDFPIYLGLVVLAYGLGTFHAQGYFTRANLWQTVKLGLGLGTAAVLLYLLFYLSFSSQAGGVLPYVFPPTRLPQYAIIFGPFLFAMAFFLAAAVLRGQGAGRGLRRTGMVWGWLALLTYGPFLLVIGAAVLLLSRGSLPIAGIDPATLQEWAGGMAPDEAFMAVITARLLNPWTFVVISLLMSLGIAALLAGRSVVTANAAGMPAADEPAAVGVSLPPAGLFAALLAVVGLALTLSVEFLYLRDSFGVRMNTVFKFYFQGWILMALASAYAAWWFIQCSRASAVLRGGFAAGLTVLTAAGLVFSAMGIYTRTHGFSFPPDLNAGATMAGSYPRHWNAFPDDWKAIQWLNANVQGTPVILEAPGGGYEHNGRISAFTGFPTLLGWSGHEYQWRGDNVIQDQRRPEIEAIFSTPDGDQALAMLQSWQVRYVIIGETEQEYIQSVCQSECNPQRALQKFEQVLSPVFSAGSTTIYQVPGSRR